MKFFSNKIFFYPCWSTRFHLNHDRYGKSLFGKTFTITTLLMVGIFAATCSKKSPQNPAAQPGANSDQTGKPNTGEAKRNSPPTVTTARVTPATVHANDTIRAEASTQDADHDQVSLGYQWFVNGSPLTGEVQSDLRPGNFRKGDQIQCEITPFDGLNQGIPVRTDTATVVNSVPEILTIEYQPKLPGKNTGIEVQINVQDHDQDPLQFTYQWYQSDQPIPNATTAKLSGDKLKKETIFWVSVSASDGEAQTEKKGPRIAISNSAPVITSTPPVVPRKTVTEFEYQVVAQDQDGDRISYSLKGPQGSVISGDGKISFRPSAGQKGKQAFEVTAMDDFGAKTIQNFEIAIDFDATPTPASSPQEGEASPTPTPAPIYRRP